MTDSRAARFQLKPVLSSQSSSTHTRRNQSNTIYFSLFKSSSVQPVQFGPVQSSPNESWRVFRGCCGFGFIYFFYSYQTSNVSAVMELRVVSYTYAIRRHTLQPRLPLISLPCSCTRSHAQILKLAWKCWAYL